MIVLAFVSSLRPRLPIVLAREYHVTPALLCYATRYLRLILERDERIAREVLLRKEEKVRSPPRVCVLARLLRAWRDHGVRCP